MKTTQFIIVICKLGRWFLPDGRELAEREVEQYPTYFSIKLGVYKLVPIVS